MENTISDIIWLNTISLDDKIGIIVCLDSEVDVITWLDDNTEFITWFDVSLDGNVHVSSGWAH
jgi:hypothetical protein